MIRIINHEYDYMSDFPNFDRGRKLKYLIVKDNKEERVFVYKKQGIWSTYHEIFYADEYENGWSCGDDEKYKYDSKETALKELKVNYPWDKNKNIIIKEF